MSVLVRSDITMDVSADAVTLEGLLSGQTLKLPPYQRNLAWDYWKAEGLIDEMISFIRKKEPKKDEDTTEVYYLGNLIIQEDGDEHNLVDGQQRLSILTILASALRDVLIDNKKFKDAGELHHAILSNYDGQENYIRKDGGDELSQFRKIRVEEIDLELNIRRCDLNDDSSTLNFTRSKLHWTIPAGSRIKIEDMEQEFTVKEQLKGGQSQRSLILNEQLQLEAGNYGTAYLLSEPVDEINPSSDVLEKIYIMAKIKFQRFFTPIKYKLNKASQNVQTPSPANGFKMKHDVFPYPNRTRKRDEIKVIRDDGAEENFCVLQSWNPHKKNVPLADWEVKLSPDVAFSMSQTDSIELGKYEQPGGKAWLQDSSISNKLVDLFTLTTFSRTTFARTSEALRTFILSNDQSRMASLHTYDLMNAFTREIIDNLKTNGHESQATIVINCWDDITTELRRLKSDEEQLILNLFLGQYACYLSRDSAECYDYTIRRNCHDKTKAFSEIERSLRTEGMTDQNEWRETISENFIFMRKFAIQYIAVSKPLYYAEHKARLNGFNFADAPGSLNSEQISSEVLGLLSVIRRKASNGGFDALLLSISAKFIDDGALSGCLKQASKSICKILYSYWVLKEDLGYNLKEDSAGNMTISMKPAHITSAYKKAFSQIEDSQYDGWLSKADYLTTDGIKEYVEEIVNHLPKIVRTNMVWPTRRGLTSGVGKDVATSSQKKPEHRRFIGLLYEIAITDEANHSNLLDKGFGVTNDMEHFFPNRAIDDPIGHGWNKSWEQYGCKDVAGRRNYLNMAGNLFVLERHINQNPSFKEGSEANKLILEDDLEDGQKSFFNSLFKSVTDIRNELRPAGAEQTKFWTPQMVRDRTKKIHQKIIEYLDD